MSAQKQTEVTLFSIEELAKRWQVSTKWVRRQIWAEKLKAKRIGKRMVRVPADEAQRFEESLPAA